MAREILLTTVQNSVSQPVVRGTLEGSTCERQIISEIDFQKLSAGWHGFEYYARYRQIILMQQNKLYYKIKR